MANGHGGARAGAGRKKDGHYKLTEEAIEKAKEGLDPLDYLLNIVRDVEEQMRVRMDAAKAALPYVHHKLISKDLQHSGRIEGALLTIVDS